MFGVDLSSQFPKKNFSMDIIAAMPSVVASSVFLYSSVASPGLTEQVEEMVLNRVLVFIGSWNEIADFVLSIPSVDYRSLF